MIDLVWPGVVVQENNLAAQVSALRKVVGGDVIATIPGRGYRFMAKPARRAGRAEPHGTGDAPRCCAPTCPPSCPRCWAATTSWQRSAS